MILTAFDVYMIIFRLTTVQMINSDDMSFSRLQILRVDAIHLAFSRAVI